LNQAGRQAEAEQAYLRAAQANPTAGNWNKLGVALLEWGDLEKAELALTQAQAIDPTASEPYYRLGQLYERQGRDEQARAALAQYLRLDPNGIYQREVRTLVQRLAP
jgi:Tetratricopeptide repeat.